VLTISIVDHVGRHFAFARLWPARSPQQADPPNRIRRQRLLGERQGGAGRGGCVLLASPERAAGVLGLWRVWCRSINSAASRDTMWNGYAVRSPSATRCPWP